MNNQAAQTRSQQLAAAINAVRAALSPALLAWLAFLGLCMLVGLAAAAQVLLQGLVITNMNDTVPWGLWITVDLSSIALGAGAFTLSAIVYLFGIKRLQAVVRLAVFVGFIGYTSALLTLVMDIGRPDRFWHPWVFWNVHSVLWEITWCITIYLCVLMVELAPVIADLPWMDRWPRVRKAAHVIHGAAPILAFLGLCISMLHQSSLGATYGIMKARPIWFKPTMPIMFILSAVSVGPALTMGLAQVIEWATGRKTIPQNVLQTIARICGLGLLAYAYLRFWDLATVAYYARTPAVSEAFAILNETTPYGFGFWLGEVIIGIVIPIVFFLLPHFNRQPFYQVAGAACAVVGIIANRWNVTLSGLIVPLSYSPGVQFQLPASTYWPSLVEWGVVIGIVGYALTMLTLGVRFLPLFPREEAA